MIQRCQECRLGVNSTLGVDYRCPLSITAVVVDLFRCFRFAYTPTIDSRAVTFCQTCLPRPQSVNSISKTIAPEQYRPQILFSISMFGEWVTARRLFPALQLHRQHQYQLF